MIKNDLWLVAALAALVCYGSAQAQPARASGGFVGSAACRDCHRSEYDRWKKTRMANVIVDPKVHPEVVLGDFSKPNELVTFKPRDVAFVYGSKWKQRYFVKRGDDYFVLPAQWDVTHKIWRAYHVENNQDWWTAYYPADQMQRPTGPLCDGCHSTNYDVKTKQVTEWNVGCEKCHGPGETHARNPSLTNIVNPARLDHAGGVDTCIQCHSQGRPRRIPLDGVYYDWPVGYQPGDKLSDFWELEEHKLGEETFTHFPDGTAHKNRMQGNDFVQSQMYKKGVACWDCHDAHGTPNDALLIKPVSALCVTCHGVNTPAGPAEGPLEHSHHSVGNAQCVDCHMPKIERTIADVNVRAHTFNFIPPSYTELYKVPNPCTTCHTNMKIADAEAALMRWPNVSAWRVGR
ncbi:MAG TPA: cytochrome c3 family protein [Gammaproteobacteria bacterium]|nr:cytochrome c3 family protein [Gammaproteobacteria bacterium]